MELQKLIEQPQTVFMGIYWLGVYKYPAPPAVLKQRAPTPIGHTMGNGQSVEKMKKQRGSPWNAYCLAWNAYCLAWFPRGPTVVPRHGSQSTQK